MLDSSVPSRPGHSPGSRAWDGHTDLAFRQSQPGKTLSNWKERASVMAIDTASTEQLVAQARAGNQEAWEEIVKTYSPLLRWVARQQRLSTQDADDAVQNTWLRCLESLSSLREPKALVSWLCTTCGRESLRIARASSRSTPFDPQEPGWDEFQAPASISPDPLEVVMQQESKTLLHEAIAELPRNQRTVITALMAERDERRGYATVSRRLGMPVGSLGPTRQRALGRLRADHRLQRVN